MVILGITGTLSSGKETAAQFLHLTLGFKIYNLEDESWEETIPRSDHETDQSYRVAVASAVLKIVTLELKQNAIIFPITIPEELIVFRKRCYFVLLGIDCPQSMRYSNYVKKHGKPKNLLQGFIYMDDHTKYGLDGYPSRISETLMTSERIVHNKSSTDDFLQQLSQLDLVNPEHARPSWDTYFIRIAEMASTRSACLSGKRGAIIVSNFKVVATGYNGTPAPFPNCGSGGCKSCSEVEICECVCIHAEINALIEAGRSRTIGSILFTTHLPCFNCAKSIIQSEIRKVVFSREESFDEEIAGFFNEGGVDVVLQSPVVKAKDFEGF